MVEIRVDTKRDSDEEIRKAIRYLQSVIGDAPSAAYPSSPASSSSLNSDSGFEPSAAPAFTNIFGSDDDAPSDMAPSDGAVEKEETDSFIEIVEY